MTAEARLAAANPVPEEVVDTLVPAGWAEAVLARADGVPRTPLRRRRRRARLALAALLLLALLLAPTYAVARGLVAGWLAGAPAPPAVVENFRSYTPQLGFRPDAARAVLVAEDGDVKLYATTNDRGSYCLAAGAPDGGTCIPPRFAAAPLVAGIVADGGSPAKRVVVAGRVADPRARTIRFDDGSELVERRLGTSGFFVAVLPTGGSPCSRGDWTPRFEALDAGRAVVAAAEIALAQRRGEGVCVWTAPHP